MKICFLDFSTKLQTIFDLKTKARGGMVTSLFRVSDGLARLGHEVTVCADIEKPDITATGVRWTNTPPTRLDALILNRGIGRGYSNIDARHRILWTHDLPHHGFALEPKLFKAISRVVFMSGYGEYIWRTFFKSIGNSVRIPNGVDKTIFSHGEKFSNHLVFASAPNRGLDILPDIFGALKEVIPDISMQVFSNLSKLHPGESGNPELYNKAKADCQAIGIDFSDPLPQDQFACALRSASLMVMPSQYPEICSNAILQSLACGTPVITTGNMGSAGEWIRDGTNGRLTKTMPHDYVVYQVEMARIIFETLKDKEGLFKMQNKAAKTPILSWEEVSLKWHKMLESVCN